MSAEYGNFRSPAQVDHSPTSVKLSIQSVGKVYGTSVALRNINLSVESGEFLTILGPSGSGKTTLLNIICGLLVPSTGRLLIDGVDCTDVPAHKRDIGVIFQSYSLFPHMTIGHNLAFPLEMRGVAPQQIAAKVAAGLELVGLRALEHRLPGELSGGQQQRVALARALIFRPALILMDEPLAALDRQLREGMRAEIKRLHQETKTTIVFVTHDQEEALALSDRICLMNEAAITEIATPRDIYERPSSIFAARFIGASNLIEGQLDDVGLFSTANGEFATAIGRAGAKRNCEATLLLRPEHIEIGAPEAAQAQVVGRVVEATYSGADITLAIRLDADLMMTARRPANDCRAKPGDLVGLRWRAEHAQPLFE